MPPAGLLEKKFYLFRTAILACLYYPKTRSGTANNPIPASPHMSPYTTDGRKYQAHLVWFAGCTSTPDTSERPRAAPYATLRDAADTTPSFVSPNGMDYTWGITITIDGELIKKSLRQYTREGRHASVPILGGQVDDEGM
jgi:hypothetical protein